jgi:type IV pilus assembly protein PilM
MGLFSKPRVRDVTTLVFESTDLRFLETKRGQVDKWGSTPLPPGLISEGLVTDAVEMGNVLGAVFADHGLDRKRVITAINGLRSIPRLLTLPKLQASVMEQTISREARKEMPISPDNLYLSWQSLPGRVGDTQRIYLLGVPRELIDAQVRALQASGVQPYVMDLKPLALIRAIGREDAIIVNLEENELDITLVTDYLPAIMRTFSLSQEGLDVQGKLERLVSELTQTVRFYNDSHPSTPIEHATSVHLTGRLLEDPEAYDYLRDAVDWPVERIVPPLPCPDALPVMEYATNIGLALKKVE